MFKKIVCSLIVILFIVTAFGLKKPTAKTYKDILVVGTCIDYPPYEFYDQDNKPNGFDIDLAKSIANKLGLKLEIKDVGFDVLILSLQQGKIDLIISAMSISDKKLKQIHMVPYYGDQVQNLSLAFWGPKPSDITCLEDIAHSSKPVVAVQTATLQSEFLNSLKGIETKILMAAEDLVLDLQYRKSKAALFEQLVASAMQKKFPEITIITVPLPEEFQMMGNGIGIQKNNLDLINQVEKTIAQLKEDGTINKLSKTWMGKEK